MDWLRGEFEVIDKREKRNLDFGEIGARQTHTHTYLP